MAPLWQIGSGLPAGRRSGCGDGDGRDLACRPGPVAGAVLGRAVAPCPPGHAAALHLPPDWPGRGEDRPGAPRRAWISAPSGHPDPGPAASAIVVVSVAIAHACRGRRPLMRCSTQPWGAGNSETARARTRPCVATTRPAMTTCVGRPGSSWTPAAAPVALRRRAASHPTSSPAKPGPENRPIQERPVTPHPGTEQDVPSSA